LYKFRGTTYTIQECKILDYERSVNLTYPFILKGWLKLGRIRRPEHVAHKGKQETVKKCLDGRPK
jgi:hypothetical protein